MSPRASQQAETENSGKEVWVGKGLPTIQMGEILIRISPTPIFDKQPDFLVTAPQIDVKIPCYCSKVAKNCIAERDHLHMTKAEYRPILSQSEPGRDER
ncbi:hypothetical protein TWF225_007828 [Orbilia oligospora]|nr:hypothetical protein TWF751_010725 [Orbilia oligospora]KAF3178811.1 hypothetical protein TWF225_007828 [Orbilia oligospora]KAF3245689.1 hypothetical protein TWF128_009390 [Orbilia oligospora]KAF3257270.1 hypothetical protein TWF217_006017 [Orbilia oligospora]KAF3275342.1 hypothetical protein TWF132_002935 [Orbilia oligospora]